MTAAADVTDEEMAQGLVRAALGTFGRVDALVHNAFAIPPLQGLADVDLDAVRAGFETNVIGALRMIRLFTPALAETRGSVVMINSAVLRHSQLPVRPVQDGQVGVAGAGPEPGRRARPAGDPGQLGGAGLHLAGSLKWYFGQLAQQRGVTRQQVYDETAATLDLRRLPEPDEVADAVVFLASDLARAITGQCLERQLRRVPPARPAHGHRAGDSVGASRTCTPRPPR